MTALNLKSIHHAAYRCRDAEQTRWFYEDVLGLPYSMALVEDNISGTDIHRPYMHLFFQLNEDTLIAFFDDPNSAKPEDFEHKDSFDVHLAIEVDTLDEVEEWKARIKAARVKCFGPVNHGFVQSLYFYDPNGLPLEITTKTAEHDQVTGELAKASKKMLEDWTRDTRDQKLALFGEAELDRREVSKFYDYMA